MAPQEQEQYHKKKYISQKKNVQERYHLQFKKTIRIKHLKTRQKPFKREIKKNIHLFI